jgi:hypothetical protein
LFIRQEIIGQGMKKLLVKIVALFLILIASCGKSDNSVNAPGTSTPQIKTIPAKNYILHLDSTYYKMWSDSSWEKFNGDTIINGKSYIKVINSVGTEYYYTTLGYAGVKAIGDTLILFDKELTSLPDTLEIGKKYNLSTTFNYYGYNYTLNSEETLLDTVSVSVPFGVVNSCLWLNIKTTISSGALSQIGNSQSWLAPNIYAIKKTLSAGSTIIMVKGVVNGKGWGMSFPKDESLKPKSGSANFFEELMRPLLNQ